MSTVRDNDRFIELDGLRGIAALWVVLYHFIGEITDYHINLRGLFGVHLFFIISGFVIFMTIGRSNTVLDFSVSRAARLYPAFWVSVLVTTFIALIFPISDRQVTIGQAAVNATMLNLYVGVPSIEPVYWSLAYEIAFYVMVAILFARDMLSKIEIIGIIWVILSFIICKLAPIFGIHVPWRLQTVLALPYASLFFAGIIFYKIWSDGATPTRVALVMLCYFEHIFMSDLIGVTGIMTSVFIIFALCVAGRGTWLAYRPFVFLGTISYSLYLIHGTLGYHLILLGNDLALPSFANLLVVTAVTVCAATAVTFLVERPANRAIRAFYRRAAISNRHFIKA